MRPHASNLRDAGGLTLAVLALALQASCSSPQPKPEAKKPNILIITVDTLRADRLGCYGYKGAETPNVDALARESVVFDRAIAQVPLTWPSHAAIFTGTYPFSNGVQDFTGQPLAPDFRTLAESLKANGYATGAVVSSFVLDRSWGLARGFDFYYDQFPAQDYMQKALALVDRRADQSVHQAISWLEARGASGQTQSGAPFFLWLHLFDPHSPYDAPEPFRTRYRQRPYDGEVAYADNQLGRLLEWLRKRPGLYDDTLIVFLSDHGESLGEHGESEHGFFIYNATVHVPLLIKPARTAGVPPARVAAPVESISVAPTVLEFAGIQDAIQKQFQSVSLRGMMKTAKSEDRASYSETFYPLHSFGWSPLRSLQTSRFHYIEAPQSELYDVQADPQEKSNLAAKEKQHAATLRAQLQNLQGRFQPKAGAGPGKASEEALAKLRSLGYVAYRAPNPASLANLSDPKAKLQAYQAILQATDAMHAGDFARSRALLAKVRQADPKLYLVPFLLGEAATRQANWPAAEAEFQRALELNPTFDQAMTGLGRALLMQGKFAAAEQWLERALVLNPQNYRALYELARAQWKDKPSAAIASLQKAIAIQPGFAPAYRDLGMAAVRAQNYPEAAQHLEKAAQLGLKDAQLLNYLGIAYSRMNQLERAVSQYQEALKADPNLAEAHLNLGFAYERLGQAQAADKEYKTVCRLSRELCQLIAQRQSQKR